MTLKLFSCFIAVCFVACLLALLLIRHVSLLCRHGSCNHLSSQLHFSDLLINFHLHSRHGHDYKSHFLASPSANWSVGQFVGQSLTESQFSTPVHPFATMLAMYPTLFSITVFYHSYPTTLRVINQTVLMDCGSDLNQSDEVKLT